MPRHLSLWPSAAIVLSASLWGTSWIPLRVLHADGWPGAWIPLLMYGAPGIFVLPFLFYRPGRGWGRHVVASNLKTTAAVGFFTGLCTVLYSLGAAYGDIVTIILLFYLNPVWSAVLERLFIGSPITWRRFSAIALGLVGMWVLVAGDGELFAAVTGIEGLGLIAGFAWAAALIANRMGEGAGQLEKAFSQYLFASLIAGAIILLHLFPTGDAVSLSNIPWGHSLLWTIIASGIWVLPAMVLGFWGASKVSPTTAAMLFLAEALVGVGSAAFFGVSQLHERHLIGGALIIVASLIEGWGGQGAERRMEDVSA